VVTLSAKDPYEIGAEFFRWKYATAVACAVLGVNAFDQPDVQDNKTRTAGKISAYSQSGALDEPSPIWESPLARVYGNRFPGLEGAQSLAQVIRFFLRSIRPGDYIAINAYLPRTRETQQSLNQLRLALRDETRLATTLGFGPRFLHSTGQLHKGGADNGVFIQITRDPMRDLSIPNLGISFGTLERAQALGDLEALQARGRRAIRIHLLEAEVGDLL
jgi:transaldolase/glucose-6-phosphate isomerase